MNILLEAESISDDFPLYNADYQNCTGVRINFSDVVDDGMMQVVVSGGATTADTGWEITDQNGKTVFTKYGSMETLTISYAES